jgi:hypothetical protein
MIDTLVPQMIQDSLRLVKRELEPSKGLTVRPGNVYDMLYISFVLGDMVERHWGLLIQECREVESGLQGVAKVLETTIRMLQDVSLDQAMTERYVRLEERQATVQELLRKAAALRLWAEEPLPPIDISSIPRSGNPLTGEGYRSGDKILEEIRQKQTR